MRKTSAETFIKSIYVSLSRVIGKIVDLIGLGRFLKKRQDKRWAHWLYSLFAIYDIDRMIELDVPWWTYEAIEKVDRFLKEKGDAKVFEYGSGASTVWLAKRAQSVTSIEHDKQWFEEIQSRLAKFPNVECILREPIAVENTPEIASEKSGYANLDFAPYLNALKDRNTLFDVIVIDGRVRSDTGDAVSRPGRHDRFRQ